MPAVSTNDPLQISTLLCHTRYLAMQNSSVFDSFSFSILLVKFFILVVFMISRLVWSFHRSLPRDKMAAAASCILVIVE